MSKKENWLKFRHKVVVWLLTYPFGLYVRLKYGIRIQPFRQQGNRPYLIVMNHQTAYDQFFVGLTFHRPVYYLASEDLFSMGWVSNLIRYLVAPIPIKKQTTDLQAIKNCIRVAREGGTICLAPEGNRTFHGKTVYMNPSIASLTKKLGLPLAIFRIEGGYGIHPRWSDVVRKGKMRCYVSRVVEPEEYVAMTNAELFALIQKELSVDETSITDTYYHKKNAEFLERAVYVCPWCGLSEFESDGDIIRCKKCDRRIRHLPNKALEGVNCTFPHRSVTEWYEWQYDYVNHLDLLAQVDTPLYRETVQLSRVHAGKRKDLLKEETTLELYGDRLCVDGTVYPFCELSAVVVLGKNKLNLYTGSEILQVKGSKRFNALKYVNLYHRHKNLTTGDHNGKFLGL